MLKWKDASGKPLNYGDIVEDFEKRIIGEIVHSHFNNQPVLRVISQFSIKSMGYVNIPNNGPYEATERSFIPNHSKLYWLVFGYRLNNIELLKKAKDESRVGRSS